MRAAIYCRVSTRDKQDITTQEHFLKEYSVREGHEVVGFYSDVGESGSKDSRPRFDAMLQDMRQGKFNAVIVYKLDRIGRSLAHLVKLFEEFRKRNIAFVSATQAINTTTPEGRMFLHMLMVLAEYERELTIDRIKAGQKRAISEGKGIGLRGKDRKKRRRSGYMLRWIRTRQKLDTDKGIYKPIDDYENKKTAIKKINLLSEVQNTMPTPPQQAGVN